MEGLGASLESMGAGSMYASMYFAVVVELERCVCLVDGVGAYFCTKTNQAFVFFFSLWV